MARLGGQRTTCRNHSHLLPCGVGDWTQVIRLAGRCLYPLIYIAGAEQSVLASNHNLTSLHFNDRLFSYLDWIPECDVEHGQQCNKLSCQPHEFLAHCFPNNLQSFSCPTLMHPWVCPWGLHSGPLTFACFYTETILCLSIKHTQMVAIW